MSQESAATTDHPAGDHHEADDGRIHAHVSSVRFYVIIFAALIALTLLTVLAGSFHLGPLNLALAVLIASAKAALVVTFFMHLNHDRRFNALLLIGALLFIGVFFAYTFNDTERRAEVDPNSLVHVYGATGEKAPGGSQIPVFVAPAGEAHGAGDGHGEGHDAPPAGGH